MVSLAERFDIRSASGDAYRTITAAMKGDVSHLELIDEHDPLGIAFYIHAIVTCNYISIETNELAEAGRRWAIEKLRDETPLSVYKDRDVSAIALIAYSFPTLGAELRGATFSTFVRPFIGPDGGVFSNFFCSTLVALALQRTEPQSAATIEIAEYVNRQLSDRYSLVTNDAKNLLVAYWWARDSQQRSQLDKLLLTTREIIAQVQPNLDALVYASFIMLQEAASFTRKERAPIKPAVEKALSAIRAHTAESLTPAVALAYGGDAAMFSDESRRAGLPGKPRLSRILIAVGLMQQQSYTEKSASLLSLKARCLQIYRGAQGCVLSLAASCFVWYIGDRVGLPLEFKSLLASHGGQLFAKAFFLCLPLDLFFAALLFAPAFMFFQFFTDLIVHGRPVDEADVLNRGWKSFKNYYWIEIGVALIATIAYATL